MGGSPTSEADTFDSVTAGGLTLGRTNPYSARKGGPSLDDNGTNPTRNPKGLPIRSSVSTVGLACPRSISASCLRVKRKRAANCCWDIPRACLIATIASGSFSRPIRASSAISVRLARISSLDGFVHRAILEDSHRLSKSVAQFSYC